MKRFIIIALLLLGLTSLYLVMAQQKVLDETIAEVGGHPVYLSDVETQYIQAKAQGATGSADQLRCAILEDMLYRKLLLYQAEIDSIKITDEDISNNIDQKIRYSIQQFGSQQKLEEFYGKSLIEIKAEFHDPIRDQLLASQAESKIFENIKITPTEAKTYFNSLSRDSIPIVPTMYEIAHIVKEPQVSPEELQAARDKISGFRDRIIKGEKSFAALAYLYSEDPGSATKSGELGFFGHGQMQPEFEAAAFNLKNKGDISEVVKTKYGYHVLQLIERRGELVNVRHILVIPKVSPVDLNRAKSLLDSVAELIQKDSLTFEKAALKFSDDPNKINGGMIINPESNNTRFPAEQMDPKIFFVIDKLKVGEISTVVPYQTEDNTSAYRILYLKTRTEPHRATLKDDYNDIVDWATQKKQNEEKAKWVASKAKSAYIRIDDRYKNCKFKYKWPL
jgi:peptidyl-prolyl cis-trans isomerase SurA